MIVEFGEYLPDLADMGACSYATNCLPYAQGFLPLMSPSAYTGAAPGTCLGAFSVRTDAGAIWNIMGTTSDLYATASSSWSLATSAGGGLYTTDQDTGWEFVKWGQTVIGVNGHTDTPEEMSISQTSHFSVLAGSPPPAKHIAVVGDFVVLGNLNDAAVLSPNRVRWSGLGNSHTWASSLVTQADYQDIQNGGDIQKIVPALEGMGIVILETSVYRMVYEGLPFIFRFNEILPGIGTPAPGSVCQIGEQIFFLGNDGFLSVTGGGNLIPIGNHKVDKTFFNTVNQSYLRNMRSAVSPVQKRVYWAYVGPGSTGGLCNKMLIYDWGINRWSSADVEVEFLLNASTPGYTLDGLDALGYTLDTLPFSLDSRAYAGSIPDVAMFDSSHRLSFFSASAMSAVIETPERQLNPSRRSLVRRVRPFIDGGSSTISAGVRDNQSESVSYAAALSPISTGSIPMRSNGRYHRFRATLTGSWKEAIGVDIEQMSDAGPR